MSTAAYRVDLDLFSGPVDLLLYLIRRSELDAIDVTLASITRQFAETIDALQVIGEQLNLELAGDFVVTIAQLIEIKGRQSLPQESEATLPEADADQPAASEDLVARLLQFKRFRDAASELAARAERQAQRYTRLASDRPTGGSDPTQDRIRGIEIWDLLSAFSRIAVTQLDKGVETIRDEHIPVHVYVEQIADRVRMNGRTSFRALFDGERKRSAVVGTFLAILELVRHHRFTAEQVEGGEIYIAPPQDDGEAMPTAASGAENA